jgi:adenylate cyclase
MVEDGDELMASRATPTVFVSYASQDAAVANSVVEVLETAGLRCWIAPRNVVPGSLYADEIIGAINDAEAVVLVVSEHAIASPHVGKEIERASSKRRRIITLRADSAPLTRAFEYFLSESQWIDLGPGGTAAAATKLVEAVRRHLDPSAVHELRVQPVAQAGQPSTKRLRTKWMVAGGVAILSLALTYVVVNKLRPTKRGAASADVSMEVGASIGERSIAVLPFTDLSEKHDQEYFADGLSEELVGVLGKLPGLRVIEHGSSFRLRGKGDDPRSVGAQLGTAHVVQGSVRRAGNHVRVTTQLIRTSDGAQEWSGTFDRDVQDILQVQSEIATSVGRSLQLSVAAVQDGSDEARPSAEAYDLYLRALHANDRVSNDGFQEALTYLQRALELDPHFVRAQEALAITHLLQAVFGAVPSDVGFGRVRDDATRLLQLDPHSGWGQTLLCRFHTEYSWDWPEAERQCAAAVALAPRFWLALYAAADLAMIRGDYAKAERLFREIFPIDPLNADTYMELGLALRAAGRLAEAEAAFRRGLAITPTYITGHLSLGSVLLTEGRLDEARQAFELEAPEYGREAGLAMTAHARGRTAEAATALKRFIQGHGSEQPYIVATAYAYSGATDQAFDWLERAYRQRDPLMPYIKGEVLVRSLQRDPRYKAFLQKMKLSE